MLAPARPSHPGTPETWGALTTCWGRQRGRVAAPSTRRRTGNVQKLQTRCPSPEALGLGSRCPLQPSGSRDRVVEELVQVSGGCNPREARPSDTNCRHCRPLSLQARDRDHPGSPPSSALRSLEPSGWPLIFRARSSESRAEKSPPSPASSQFPVPAASHSLKLRETLPVAPGPPLFLFPPALAFPSCHRHATVAPDASPPHLRRLRQRWTQETPGSPTPALLDPLFG